MDGSIDVVASIAIGTGLTVALGAYVVASVAAGRLLVEQRVLREEGLPLLGRAPMHAVYRALVPFARLLVAVGISANAVSVVALSVAAGAAVAFATGHFGVGAAIACVSALADALDGLVARTSGTVSRFGKILDTTIDRYVDALLLGGIAVHVRSHVWLLVVTLLAITGSFMVSYASALERELRLSAPPGAMRRAHRLAYLVGAAAVAPLVARALGDDVPRAELLPVMLAVASIALVGNVSAVRRMLSAAKAAVGEPDSSPNAVEEEARLTEETPR